VPGIRTHILQTSTPYDFRDGAKKIIQGQTSLFQQHPEVLISSYAKLTGWAETLAPIIRTIVFDEVQELRHPDTNKYAAAAALREKCSFRIGLTATPIYNYGDEFFNVADIIAPGELGSKGEFLREWCSGNSIDDPKAFGSYTREHGLMLRRTAKEVGMELPKLTTIVHTIASDLSALNAIESPATELAKIILKEGESSKGEKFRASEEFTNILRQATGIAKAPYVAEFVRMLLETGEKVILWGWHHAVYDIWRERLKEFHPVMFTGIQSSKQKIDSKRSFIEGDSQLMIMSLRSGEGTDGLQKVCHIGVVGELDWTPQVHKQCSGRLDRPGQELPVMLYYLVSSDGCDPFILDILGLKKSQSDGILDPKKQEVEFLENTEKHTKKLAAEYLRLHYQKEKP
jgi:SNF2 family DNA or RNA helicase